MGGGAVDTTLLGGGGCSGGECISIVGTFSSCDFFVRGSRRKRSSASSFLRGQDSRRLDDEARAIDTDSGCGCRVLPHCCCCRVETRPTLTHDYRSILLSRQQSERDTNRDKRETAAGFLGHAFIARGGSSRQEIQSWCPLCPCVWRGLLMMPLPETSLLSHTLGPLCYVGSRTFEYQYGLIKV